MIKHQRLLRASPTRQTHDRRPLGGAHGSRALKGERNGNCRHAAIDGLAARVMMGPEEMALLRLARAAAAQRRLVASAAQQERDARAAAAQRAQRRLVAYWTLALAAPLPARLATLITQLETQDVSA